MKERTIPELPPRRVHKVPRILMTDAYTAGSNEFESEDCKDESIYYVVLRRELFKINPALYNKGDNRTLFVGLPRIMDELFYEPVTHEEIDLAKEFLEHFKVTNNGLCPYTFPEEIWRSIVDDYEGRIPLEIMAMPDGSVVYPGEPVIQIKSQVKGWGILAAWFEEAILHIWAPSERLTQSEHWLDYLKGKVRQVDPHMLESDVHLSASSMLTDFGARAAVHESETEILGMYGLISFPGTDSLSAGFYAWMNSDKTPGHSLSVKALAHRNVQGYDKEDDCYNTFYERSNPGDIDSMVADCYGFYRAVRECLLPLALRSKNEGTRITVVGRPDSGDPKDQVLWLIDLAIQNGLYTTRIINGVTWYSGTWLKFIEGDGMTFEVMADIIDALIDRNLIFWEWGLFGQGGGQRNGLKRDNTGAKYALCAKGSTQKPVVKLSETLGKTTLPGPFKILRSPEALEAKKTIVHISEPGENAMVLFYNGLRREKPFGPGQYDGFNEWKARVREQFPTMPKNLDTSHGAPASDLILQTRFDLITKYAPDKDLANY